MRLMELSSVVFNDVTRKAKRAAIAGGIIFVCAIVILVECIEAGRLALEPAVGPVWARVIIAGLFGLIALAAAMGFAWASQRSAQARAVRDAHGEDPRAAIIAEAISLGYSLGRDFMKASETETEPQSDASDGKRRPRSGDAADERPAA